MDLETENRIAAILLKEAAELRRQAEKEGVHVYLQRKVRGRPNSRFLTATVLGVQQANRAVEVNEMWRVRQKELDLNNRLKGRSKDRSSCRRDIDDSRSLCTRHGVDDCGATASLSKRECENNYLRKDDGLRDEDVEEFLHSRVKRGRGAVGSRMDETGPYLAHSADSNGKRSTSSDVWQHCVFGPEKTPSLKPYESSDEDEGRRKKTKKEQSSSMGKCSRKHQSKEKSRRKKMEEKRRKHRK